jgi:hypothetical protein
LRLLKSIKTEKQSDVFDLSTPTAFDHGFLIFKSSGEKYAVFFAMALSLSSIDFRRLQRTLKILLKVFPQSTSFSLEWVAHKACYASFYFKVNKEEIIARTRELVENVQTSFKSIFGSENVRPLNEPELLSHLAYGAQGKIRKATSVDRFSVKLTTTCTHRIIALFPSTISKDCVNTILRRIPNNGSYRSILSVKTTDKQQSMGICLNITSSTPNKENHTVLNQLVTSSLIQRAPASEIIRHIGDILTRNFPESRYQRVSLDTAVTELSSFVKECNVCCNSVQDSQSTAEESVESSGTGVEWRAALEQLAEQLAIRIEWDVLLLIDGFPLRIDAKIQDIYIKIIPKYYHDSTKLQWLTHQLSNIIEKKLGKYVILLPEEPIMKSLIEETLNQAENKRSILTITSKRELHRLLSRKKPDFVDPVVITTEAI